MSATTTRILNDLRAQLPGALDPIINAELFRNVVELCQDCLQIAPPTDASSDPETWVSDDLWITHQRLLMYGTLASLMVQPEKPYSSAQLATAYAELWAQGKVLARQIAATTAPATPYDRVMANLRANIHGARDPQIQQELFNVADELCRNVLQITPPAGTDPAAWLDTAVWDNHARLLIAGTTVRLLTQPGKPYTDPALAGYHKGVYDDLVSIARGDANAGPETLVTDRLMENLRVRLPSSKDSVIQLELFNTIDEACRTAGIWIEAIPVTLVAGQDIYVVTPAGTEIVELVALAHPTFDVSGATYDAGQIVLGSIPTADDVAASPLYATATLTPTTAGNDDPSQWLPEDLWPTHHELLLDGVLGRMMSQLAKPYSNPVFATFHARRFRNAMAMARNGVVNGGVAGARTWSFPRGFF